MKITFCIVIFRYVCPTNPLEHKRAVTLIGPETALREVLKTQAQQQYIAKKNKNIAFQIWALLCIVRDKMNVEL